MAPMDRTELLIEADELAAIINQPDLRIFDATVVFDPAAEPAAEAYLKRHIPGAAFLDHAVLSKPDSPLMYTLPDETTLSAGIGSLGISNESPVIVYSTDMIGWATRVWWVLRYAGHHKVRVLNGGLNAWQGDLSSGKETYPAATFKSALSPRMFASKQDVIDAIKSGSACVANTLTPEIYRGETGLPYDGHISGSVNDPFLEYSNGASLRPDEAIKASFADKSLGDRLITYCGGGIAATVNACAAKLAGIEDVAVYDGSMSEWLAEDLPITQGSDTGTLAD